MACQREKRRRGPAQSKTLARRAVTCGNAQRLGVLQPSGALSARTNMCQCQHEPLYHEEIARPFLPDSATNRCGRAPGRCGGTTLRCPHTTSRCGRTQGRCAHATGRCGCATGRCLRTTGRCGHATMRCAGAMGLRLWCFWRFVIVNNLAKAPPNQRKSRVFICEYRSRNIFANKT